MWIVKWNLRVYAFTYLSSAAIRMECFEAASMGNQSCLADRQTNQANKQINSLEKGLR